MTLPGSGSISLGSINSETGRGGQTSLSFVNGSLLKPGYRNRYDLNSYHGFAWYQKNNEANCNNGNCGNCTGNCGNIQCINCQNCYQFNCNNCDGQAWLQPNCNCGSTNCMCFAGNCNCYAFQCNNCIAVSYDCNCNCDCGGG